MGADKSIIDVLRLVYDRIEDTESPLLYIFTDNLGYGVMSYYGEILIKDIEDRKSIEIFKNDKRHIVCVKQELTAIIYKAYDNGCKVILKKLIQSKFTVDRLLQEAMIVKNGQVYAVVNYKGLQDDFGYRNIIYHRDTEEILCVKFARAYKDRRQLIDVVDIRNKRGKIIKTVFGWSIIPSNYYMIGTCTLHNTDIQEVSVEYSKDHKKSLVTINRKQKVEGIRLDNSIRHCISLNEGVHQN